LSIGEHLVVGVVAGAFGIHGWVKVISQSDNPERFKAGETFLAEGPKGERHELTLEEMRPAPGVLRIKFAGVEDREAAAALKGRRLLIREEEAGELPEDAYWEHQILGLRVVTVAGVMLGVVEDIIYGAGNEVYVVKGEEREHLIPSTKEVVVRIDLDEGVMVVDPLPGLLEL
jgi:16S rRNA processing protein RimM